MRTRGDHNHIRVYEDDEFKGRYLCNVNKKWRQKKVNFKKVGLSNNFKPRVLPMKLHIVNKQRGERSERLDLNEHICVPRLFIGL